MNDHELAEYHALKTCPGCQRETPDLSVSGGEGYLWSYQSCRCGYFRQMMLRCPQGYAPTAMREFLHGRDKLIIHGRDKLIITGPSAPWK